MYPEFSPAALIETWTIAIKRYTEQFWGRFREEAVQTVDRLAKLPGIDETFEEHLVTLRAEPSYFSEQGNASIFLEELCQTLCLTPDDQEWQRLYTNFLDPIRRFLWETSRLYAPSLDPVRQALYQRLVEFMLDLPAEEFLTTGSALSSPRGNELHSSDPSLGSGDIVVGSGISPRTLSGLSHLAAQSRRLSF